MGVHRYGIRTQTSWYYVEYHPRVIGATWKLFMKGDERFISFLATPDKRTTITADKIKNIDEFIGKIVYYFDRDDHHLVDFRFPHTSEVCEVITFD